MNSLLGSTLSPINVVNVKSISEEVSSSIVGYPLKNQGINTYGNGVFFSFYVGYPLKITASTPYKLEFNESQLFITKKLSEFFECLNIESAYATSIFIFKPQTKAFQHAQPKMGNEIHIYFISKNIFRHYKDSLFFLFINKLCA